MACLSLLNRLDAIDVSKATEFVISCMNFDGGFGCRPGSESHAGQVSDDTCIIIMIMCKSVFYLRYYNNSV